MDSSLIIPTYNKSSRLKLVLESILKLSYKDKLEIIFVNDGSTDDTSSILHDFADNFRSIRNRKIIILDIENGGRAYARNTGLKEAKGEVVIFSDDDLILDAGYIDVHCKRHAYTNNQAVHGRILNIPYVKFFADPATGETMEGIKAAESMQSKIIQQKMIRNGDIIPYLTQNSRITKFEKDIYNLYCLTDASDSYVRWIGSTGGNFSASRKILEEAGGFDINFGKAWGCEDLELGYRLYKKGVSFIYDTNAKNYHMDHYRPNAMDIHEHAMNYFCSVHQDKSLELLKKYFSGDYPDLIAWKSAIDIANSRYQTCDRVMENVKKN